MVHYQLWCITTCAVTGVIGVTGVTGVTRVTGVIGVTGVTGLNGLFVQGSYWFKFETITSE